MNIKLLSNLVALQLLSACTTDPYSHRPDIGSRTTGGALVGAAAGAAMGGYMIPGAAAGMLAGGAIGAATTAIHGHGKYHKDTRGYCYYINRSGHAVYNYKVSC